MTTATLAATSHAPSFDPDDGWSDRLVSMGLMAILVALCYLLCAQIVAFSSSLGLVGATAQSDAFVVVSRICASLVILVLAKDVIVTIIAGLSLTRPTARGTARRLDADAPLVSTIVPAFNEGDVIEETLKSLVALDYPRHEIVLVDDGSTDDTLEKARKVAAQFPDFELRIVSQPNSGKWQALNVGIAKAGGDLVFCVDADSVIRPDALRHMVPHFDRPEVAAVSGQVQVRNQSNLLTRLQALEYLVANGGARTAQATNGCVLIVPGPIGLFRRAVLAEVSRHYFAEGARTGEGAGPFSRHTYAEDFELSVMVCGLGYEIVYEPNAVSLTTAPDTMPALLNQRYRWLRGSMQVAARYNREGWGRRAGGSALGWWMTVSTTAELYVVPAACLLLLATLAWTVWMGEVTSILALWMLVWAIHMCTAAMFIRSHGERMSLALLAPMHSLYGAFLLTGAWLLAVWDETAARPMRW